MNIQLAISYRGDHIHKFEVIFRVKYAGCLRRLDLRKIDNKRYTAEGTFQSMFSGEH